MTSRMSPENMSGLIDTVMRSHGLHVRELREKMRVHRRTVPPVHVHGIGWFECDGCQNKFRSYFSWLTIDLIEQMVTKSWTMKCKKCYHEIVPLFDLDLMVERACRVFKHERPVKTYEKKPVKREDFPDPHRPELCEKCAWGRLRCWRAPRYVAPFKVVPSTPTTNI